MNQNTRRMLVTAGREMKWGRSWQKGRGGEEDMVCYTEKFIIFMLPFSFQPSSFLLLLEVEVSCPRYSRHAACSCKKRPKIVCVCGICVAVERTIILPGRDICCC